MKIKIKVFILTTLSVIILAIVTSVIFYFSYFGYIKQREEESIKKQFEVIEYILGSESDNLYNILVDWAKWDDTYEFINDLNEKYIKANLSDDTFINLNLKAMYFLNDNGSIIYKKSYEIDEDTSERILEKSILNNASINPLDMARTGLVMEDNKLYIISKTSTTSSNDKSQINGSLIFIKEVDTKLLSYIDQVSGITLRFKSIESVENKNSIELDGKIKTYNEKEYLEANKVLIDIRGENSIVFTALIQQDNSRAYFFRNFVISFAIVVLIIVWVDLIFANKYFIKRLLKLNKFIENISNTKDTTLRINMSGKDEIYKLSEATNKMLSEISSANRDMMEMSERFRTIIESTNDGYLDMNVKTQEMYISLEWKNYIGYKGLDEHELFVNYFSKIHPECLERLRHKFFYVINGKVEYFSEEYRIVKESGSITWVQQRGKVVEQDEEGNSLRIVSTLSDITDRKKYEEEILFLSYSDKLTGLRNRAFMEKEFQQLDKDKESNYNIIMGDINGLKVTNAILGHKEGNRILTRVSEIIKKICEDTAIISRWGGDEFVILVRNKNEDYISHLINKIRESCETSKDLSISIAFGYGKWDERTTNSEGVMNLAEERLYRKKLLENKSQRSASINSLLTTLYEKNTETQEHTMRIKYLSSKLGIRLGLRKDKLEELALLSLLHDIGKIGIPEQILMKPGKLTAEEWIIMKNHSSIGYRIANSTPELAHISDEILAHHERYDGTGYPNELKGKEIPLLSRIINIVDSFDVMTHKRVYKEAFDKSYVLEELKRCSGGQFDSVIVEEFIKLLEEEIDGEYN
ncbi:HD domain-containing phosphohydrolase [Clostridium vincentii]|uniref:Cyclic di-GMP phosphodiesterase response regulator RpfG n=1 Tax=Clostridium vincentii TaxID=52704 RepID=A0A2T0BA28_9CLOT|nr:HD domain-containing phosphohydrolase [Clostridium vincentii]PRR80744.1 Cyclic di-GMP phosphodiesterase response regulator RpfG [Clostridium vincentii]